MSIRDVIASHFKERLLFQLIPAIPGSPTVRTMFVSDEIHRVLMGPWDDPDIELRMGRLRTDLDYFVQGGIIAVGTRPYRKKKTAYMSRLDPEADEVWEIRSIDPKPGVRVFGSFAEKDMFVALDWEYRKPLGGPGSREWRDARERAKAHWRRLFPSYLPYKGTSLHDYASDIIPV